MKFLSIFVEICLDSFENDAQIINTKQSSPLKIIFDPVCKIEITDYYKQINFSMFYYQ